jgi:hypothetical protein
VQSLDHVAKLVERAERVCSGAVPVMRRKERDGLITPIIAEVPRPILLVKGKDREKLDRADAKVL